MRCKGTTQSFNDVASPEHQGAQLRVGQLMELPNVAMRCHHDVPTVVWIPVQNGETRLPPGNDEEFTVSAGFALQGLAEKTRALLV
jgi:hypothetical protein